MMALGSLHAPARRAAIAVLDFETTGPAAGLPSEPWQVGIVRLRHARVVPEEHFHSYLHVGDRPFNPHAPGRHAQLRPLLARSPTAADLWPDLAQWTALPLAAHNVSTERTVLARLAPLHRFGPWIDTLALTRHAYPRLPSNALDRVADTLGLVPRIQALCPGRQPHDALYDAFACALLLEHLLNLPGWETATLADLAST